jgi:hypothetical protein
VRADELFVFSSRHGLMPVRGCCRCFRISEISLGHARSGKVNSTVRKRLPFTFVYEEERRETLYSGRRRGRGVTRTEPKGSLMMKRREEERHKSDEFRYAFVLLHEWI